MHFPAALAALLLLTAAPAIGAAPPTLAAHRALYDLKLDLGHHGDIVAASGTMGYEMIDACDGWTVRQRLWMVVTDSEDRNVEMVSDYSTYESKDGLRFSFHMKQFTEGAITSQTDGTARLTRRGGPGEAHYSTPDEDVKKLPPGTLFPMAHTGALVAAARDGKRFLTAPLFDGTVEDGAQDSSVAIVGWRKPQPNKYAALAALPSTRVRIAFFERKPEAMTPEYQVGMRYWENGVADDMQMDFGDFTMNAHMTEFKPVPTKCR